MQLIQAFRIIHRGEDITDEIRHDLSSIVIDDRIGLESDSLSITLKNDSLVYLKAFLQGDSIAVEITDMSNNVLNSGSFQIDTISGNIGDNSIITIEALSASAVEKSFTKQINYSRRRVYLDTLLQDVLKKIDISLFYRFMKNKGAPWKLSLKNIKHFEETIGSIVSEYAEMFRCIIKVHNGKLVFSDKKSFENDKVVKYFKIGRDAMSDFSYQLITKPYKIIKTSFYDPKKGKRISDERASSSTLTSGETKTLIKKLSDKNVAQAIAESVDSYDRFIVDFKTFGDVQLVAGAVIELSEIYGFSGKYLIKKATHEINNEGWTTRLNVVNLF